MLDERDLQAIAKMISDSEARTAEKISTSESRMTALMTEQISASEARTAEKISASEARMMALMEAWFEPRFNLLAEGQKLIREQMVKKEDLEAKQEDIQTQLDVLRALVKRNSLEIEKLKKAQ